MIVLLLYIIPGSSVTDLWRMVGEGKWGVWYAGFSVVLGSPVLSRLTGDCVGRAYDECTVVGEEA